MFLDVVGRRVFVLVAQGRGGEFMIATFSYSDAKRCCVVLITYCTDCGTPSCVFFPVEV